MHIYAEQVNAFEQAAWRSFEVEMMEHSKNFAPELCATLGDEQLLVALRMAMSRAWEYGLTNRGPILLFVELMFLCGSGFDNDPQYPFAGEALRSGEDQMVRAEKLHAGHNVYMEEVAGPEAIHVHKAFPELALFVREPLPFDQKSLDARLHIELQRIFPQEARYVGDAGITMLIEEARSVAAAYGFIEDRQVKLVVVLMFAFGHGCANDPLYPWIASTLQDKRLLTPTDRAEQLEKTAVTWLTHVLAPDEAGLGAWAFSKI
jgi:hypothetical protein